MSCAAASMRRVGQMDAHLSRVSSDFSASVQRVGHCDAGAYRIGPEMTADMRKIGSMFCRMGLVCGTSLDGRILWAQDGKVLNVYGKVIYVTVR